MSFDNGNKDGNHYWLTPPELMEKLNEEFDFDFDACPYPKPESFNGLDCEWGKSTYVNPPFGSIIIDGRKKGPTAWAKKAIDEMKKGKDVVLVYPVYKWILMLLEHCSEVRNLKDVKWCSIENGQEGKGIGQHIACFILKGNKDYSEK